MNVSWYFYVSYNFNMKTITMKLLKNNICTHMHYILMRTMNKLEAILRSVLSEHRKAR